MKILGKKLDPLTVVAIVIMAISITLLDFDDLSWQHNIKSYIGLLAFIVLLLLKRYSKSESE